MKSIQWPVAGLLLSGRRLFYCGVGACNRLRIESASRIRAFVASSATHRLIFFLWLILPLSLIAQIRNPATATSQNRVARVAIMAECIEGAVNQDDALANTKVWCETIFANTGFMGTEAYVLKDAASAVARLNARELDVLGLPTWQYIDFEKSMDADPTLAYMHDGKVTVEYVLIVNKDAGIVDIGALRGKRAILLTNGLSVMTRLWCNSILMKSGVAGEMNSYFKEIKEVQKASQAILPVFFGQKEAGIVTRSAFDAAVTLNPQIGKKVTILAASPPFVPMVTCVRRTLDPASKSRISSKALTLHQTPSGLQTFTLFKIDRFVLWEPGFAETTRALVRQLRDLTATKFSAR
jgi:ABC-type phosphate/phosphonate transport system substrate-binding protein